ncbi:MAG: molybdopterin cofactor-binding domain-containing protein [Thalassobaculum sp.]
MIERHGRNRAARRLGIDPAEIRRAQLHPAGRFPYQTPVALQYDSGDYDATLDKAQSARPTVAGFAARKAEAAKRGKLRGIGLFDLYGGLRHRTRRRLSASLGARAGLCEVGRGARQPDRASVDGLHRLAHAHGQGHETTFAQLVSDRLGVPMDNIDDQPRRHRQGASSAWAPTARAPLAVGGEAIIKAMDKVVAKAKKIAAHMLEAAGGDVDLQGRHRSRSPGTDKTMAFGKVALAAYVPAQLPARRHWSRAWRKSAFYDPPNFTFPAGCHICEVEVDPDTGVVRDRATSTAVDDFGTRDQSDDRRGPDPWRPGPGDRPGAAGRLCL